MREIKFRGQDFETGEWLYGSYNGVNAGAADVFIIYEKEIFDPVSLGFIDTEIVEKEVKEETVGQYTGLKDKNGVEIYEGDILKKMGTAYINPWYGVIGGGLYCARSVGQHEAGSNVIRDEVIGNIYENPELLEAQS